MPSLTFFVLHKLPTIASSPSTPPPLIISFRANYIQLPDFNQTNVRDLIYLFIFLIETAQRPCQIGIANERDDGKKNSSRCAQPRAYPITASAAASERSARLIRENWEISGGRRGPHATLTEVSARWYNDFFPSSWCRAEKCIYFSGEHVACEKRRG